MRCVISLVAMLMAMTSIGAAQDSSRTNLNYEDADLRTVAAEISNRTGFQFVLDPRLQGRVNIISPPGVGLTPEEIFEVFLATLQVNNFTAIPAGDRIYKIVPVEQGVRDSGPVDNARVMGGTVTRIVPLANIDARAAASTLRGLVGQQGLVVPVAESNALIIVDTGRNIERVVEVIRSVDVDESIVRAVTLENASAENVAATLEQVVGDQTNRTPGSTVQITANPPTNQVVLRGPAKQIRRIAPLIEELDRAGSIRGSFDAIYLNHADGEKLVPILTELLNGVVGGSEGGSGAGASGGPVITFHKPTNSILVNAPPEAQSTIRQLVNRLDIRRPQVLIEAIVVEINNNTARELGVQYLSGGDGIPLTAATFTDTQPNLLSAAGAAFFLTEEDGTREVQTRAPNGDIIVTEEDDVDNDVAAISGQLVQAAISDLLSFNGFLGGFGGVTDSGDVYGVLVSAIKQDGRSNVLSTPFTTVLDNETALLQVGQEIPIVTGEAVGSDFQGGFRNIEREDIGNILEVTPQINDGDTVLLNIRLEVSSIGAFTTAADSIITNKSVVETVAVADNGQTLIIGGLVDNDRRNTQSKVPILGDIPLLGFLFRGSTRSEEETTLMIFIRPTIIRNRNDADLTTAKKYDFVVNRQMKADRQKEGVSRLESWQDELMGRYNSLEDHVSEDDPEDLLDGAGDE
ncbi:MAG: type II secretion system secretin GspD [Pseudomonadota bacterium]